MENETACIFNIQHFSIHDGPGIRTSVFFKGCPLSCKWCSNPESQYNKPQILWDETKCIKCLKCISACPNNAISLSSDKIHIAPYKCTILKDCISVCESKALSIEGTDMSIDEVVFEALKDKDFYEESNGGVTFSGGEVLLYTDFAVKLADELKKHDIHCAAETSAYASKDTFAKLTDAIDLVLFDLKHYDSDTHYKYTGVYMEKILENLQYLIVHNKEFIVRIPVIPGFNDSLEDAKEFAKLLKKYKIDTVELLPFHQFGERKYDMLNEDYEYKGVKQLNKEDLTEYIKTFKENGIECITD